MMKRAMVAAAVLATAVTGGAALTLLTPGQAECEDPSMCRPQETRLDEPAYLRALSLDLRGVVPAPEEYEAGATEQIDAWLDSPEFVARVVRRHRELLWPNIENVGTIYHFRRSLGTARVGASTIWLETSTSTRLLLRGHRSATCLDEPATFDASGNVVTRTITMSDGEEANVEGYVTVRPYWDLSTELKVCALDAREARMSPSGTDCSTRAGATDAGCGCGPNLRWCHTGTVQREVLASFGEEMEKRIAAHIAADEPYHELFTSRRAFINGPLTHYWRHHRLTYNSVQLIPEAVDVQSLPKTPIDDESSDALAWSDDETWIEMELPEEHAGVLTHPVYLLRFQTNRARASRFYDAFLCEPFQAPPGGIPIEDEVAALQPDVQQRPGCNYCHAVLEPAAAHWGRWTQQGGGFLSPDHYPEFLQECADCGRGLEQCSDICRLNYVTRALSPEEEPNLGRLRAFEFLRPEHEQFVEMGPAALVRAGLADGRFTSCTVRRTAEWLLGRELHAEEEPWVRELTGRFLESDFRYRELVRAIVTSDTYRRAL